MVSYAKTQKTESHLYIWTTYILKKIQRNKLIFSVFMKLNYHFFLVNQDLCTVMMPSRDTNEPLNCRIFHPGVFEHHIVTFTFFHWSLQTVQEVFTFGRDVDKHGLTKASELFPSKHFAPNPNFMIDVCLKSIKRATGGFHKFDLWRSKQDSITTSSAYLYGVSIS